MRNGVVVDIGGSGTRIGAVVDGHVVGVHGAEVATVALAWLRSQPGVVAPIASARVMEQLPALVASASLELDVDELASLDTASRS